MKKVILITLAMLMTASAQASDLLVLLSQNTTTKKHIELLIEQLPKLEAGSHITVLNAKDGHTVAKLSLPKNTRLHQPRALFNANQNAIAALMQFVQNPKDEAGLNLPSVLGEVARYHRRYTDILILSDIRFNLEEGHYPADTNLFALPARGDFGTRGIGERLKGKRIHWLLPQGFDDARYGENVQRFIHLYLARQSAELVSFTHDKAVVMQRLQQNAAPLPMTYTISEAMTSTAPSHPTYLQLGIGWQAAGIDLDIYALIKGETLPVFYANSQTVRAQHFKDIVTGSSGTEQFEIIRYLQDVDICTVIVGVNFYRGIAPDGVKATLKAQYGNKQYQHDFTFTAHQGNQGKDSIAVLRENQPSTYTHRFALSDTLFKQECQ
ncbi:hypothetical protein [Alteromonas sp. a30]|uniref:hypothetical protein n=1 Tax=Alteromonas sp. a30 TaxID=2730917 RepID=UPI00228066D8|nr:hypothetical protein [Alteromonas sp. a30]MCY7297302.1 hypothetical protein [Alteromonas sp. a30]